MIIWFQSIVQQPHSTPPSPTAPPSPQPESPKEESDLINTAIFYSITSTQKGTPLKQNTTRWQSLPCMRVPSPLWHHDILSELCKVEANLCFWAYVVTVVSVHSRLEITKRKFAILWYLLKIYILKFWVKNRLFTKSTLIVYLVQKCSTPHPPAIYIWDHWYWHLHLGNIKMWPFHNMRGILCFILKWNRSINS